MEDGANDLVTELTLAARSGERASVKNLPASVMQAVYREITGRTETLSRVFRDNYVIGHAEIIQLIERLTQALGQYNVNGIDVQIKVSYLNESSHNFTSLSRFRTINFNNPEKTTGIDLVFSFLIATPEHGVYQNYRFIAEFRSYFLDKDFENLMYHGDEQDPNAVVKIEYVDYVVAKSILSIFEDWLRTLDMSVESRPIRTFREMRYENINLSLSLSVIAIIATTCSALTYVFIDQVTPINNLRWGIVIIAFLVSAPTITRWINAFYNAYFWSAGHFLYLVLNKADQRNLSVFQEKRARRKTLFKRVIAVALAGVTINIIAAVAMILIGLQKL